jgi:hypothetical protein
LKRAFHDLLQALELREAHRKYFDAAEAKGRAVEPAESSLERQAFAEALGLRRADVRESSCDHDNVPGCEAIWMFHSCPYVQ